jgi:UV radiation resistance-associated gene protein
MCVVLINCQRRFPLFARGVDTYRFEYGVFLLNKNIEMVRCLPPF